MDNELTDTQLAELRQLLEKAQVDVEQGLQASTNAVRGVDLESSIGPHSRVDALQQQHLAMDRRRRHEVRLQQLRGAIHRIDAATYGLCLRCGEPIGHRVLLLRPEAIRCRECNRNPQ